MKMINRINTQILSNFYTINNRFYITRSLCLFNWRERVNPKKLSIRY